jgi:hypothetical protein
VVVLVIISAHSARPLAPVIEVTTAPITTAPVADSAPLAQPTSPPVVTSVTLYTARTPQYLSQRWGKPYELGTRFSTKSAGAAIAVRVYGAETESGAHTIRLWRLPDAQLIAGPYEWEFSGSGWHTYTLTHPIDLQANTDYVIAVSTGTDDRHDFVSSLDGFTPPLASDYLTTYEDSGVATQSIGQLPTWQLPDKRSFFRDIVFVPTAAANIDQVSEIPAAPTLATTYYVATNGNNNWSGTLPAPNAQQTDGPWRTIQYAVNATQPGDTVYVRGGTYKEWVWIETNRSGTAASPKVFAAYPGETPTLDGAVYPSAWQTYSGSIWQVDASNIDFNWEGQARLVWEDDVWLQHANSLGTMTAGTWWYNTSTRRLYVWLHAGDDPHNHQIAVMSLRNAFHLNVASWITIDGFHIVHYYRGIDQSDSVVNQGRSMEGLTVQNCTIEHVGEGIGLAGNTFEQWGFTHHSLIQNNVIHDTQSDAVWVGSGTHHVVRGNTISDVKQAWYRGFVSAAVIVGDADDSIVEQNVIHDFHALGIDIEHFDPGSYGNRNIVRRNLVYNAGQHAISVLGANETHVENNLIYGVYTFPVLVNTEGGPALGNLIVNNTIYDSDDRAVAIIAGSPYQGQTRLPQNTMLRNNLFVSIAHYAIENDSATTSADYNLYWQTNGFAHWLNTTYSTLAAFRGIGQELHGLAANPQFMSAPSNFRLQPGSPAIDSGSNAAAPSQDFQGYPRPVDGNGDGIAVADIGAYEYWQPTDFAYLPLVLKNQ